MMAGLATLKTLRLGRPNLGFDFPPPQFRRMEELKTGERTGSIEHNKVSILPTDHVLLE